MTMFWECLSFGDFAGLSVFTVGKFRYWVLHVLQMLLGTGLETGDEAWLVFFQIATVTPDKMYHLMSVEEVEEVLKTVPEK